MSRKWMTLILSGASLMVVVCATGAILYAGAVSESPLQTQQTSEQTHTGRRVRNLSLQPEALRLSRKLGRRFAATARGSSMATGTLTVGTNQQAATIIRRQTNNGESVEIVLGGRTFTWTETEGVKTPTNSPTTEERLLAEQLILDSPDQFVLAQVRGASYFTVARSVRPTDAGDDYKGPVWNMVRVDEPQQDEGRRPLSTWRIYYINVQTGLLDRIEYQLNDQNIRTDFVEWTEQNGEKTPARVTWSSNGQIIMEYRTTSISHN